MHRGSATTVDACCKGDLRRASLIGLSLGRIAYRANPPNCSHQLIGLRDCGRVLRIGLVPPSFEAIGGESQFRMELLAIRPVGPGGGLTALWIELLLSTHCVLFGFRTT